jgi:hypothetical protein
LKRKYETNERGFGFWVLGVGEISSTASIIENPKPNTQHPNPLSFEILTKLKAS